MNQTNQNSLDDFLREFPRNQIIDTLKTIDFKIGSLHTISSKDFLYFNKLLKEYYKRIKEIADANNAISDFFSKDLQQITDKLKENNQFQKKIIDEAKLNANKILDFITLTHSSFDLLIVPFHNYKQNHITIKYLLANIKLHLTYIDVSNKTELQQSVSLVDKIIDTIQGKFESVEIESDNLNKNILAIKNNEFIEKSLGSVEAYEQLKMISNEIRKLSYEEFWPENFVANLSRRTQNCFANMGEIITNIQYHDIIRQKMEHIQLSQKELIKGLTDLETVKFSDEYIDEQLNFVAKIPEITDIQVAQLLYTNKDYQTSIEKITVKLIEVGREMKELYSIYNNLIDSNKQFEDSFLNQATQSQQIFDSYQSNFTTDWEKSSHQFENLTGHYQSLKDKFSGIFENEKELRVEIKNFEKLLKANGKYFGIELMSRLIILLSELQLNSNSLKTNLNNITQNFTSLNKLVVTFKPKVTNQIDGDTALENLEGALLKITGLSQNYSAISIQISDEITASLKNIEYYNFFKNTVEEIVAHLNDVNKKVNYDQLKNLVGKNSDVLQKLERLYTMKSERDIHAQTVEHDSSLLDNAEEQNNATFEDDIELF